MLFRAKGQQDDTEEARLSPMAEPTKHEERKGMAANNVLVVSAHAADYCTRSGGTILNLVQQGFSVHVLALTCGVRGESGGYWKDNPEGSYEACSELRKRESTEAAKTLGATIEFLDWDDYPLVIDAERTRYLIKRVLQIRPEIILTHWTVDPTNPDHANTGNAVVMACNSASQLGALPGTPAHYYPNIYFFEPTVPMSEFNKFDPDFYVDISANQEKKMQAIAKFGCQPQLGDFYVHFAKHRAFQARIWTKLNIEYAEGFKRFVPYVGKGLPITVRS
jgi:4-oxalomesaconate hydratase